LRFGSRRVQVGAALFFALLALSCALAVVVVRSRTPDLVLEVCAPNPDSALTFAPGAVNGPSVAKLDFFVRESDPAARVTIINGQREVVRTLDESVALEAGKRVKYDWDGRDDDGDYVKEGRYRLRVELPERGRDMVWPRRLEFSLNPADANVRGWNACDPNSTDPDDEEAGA